MDPEEDIQQVTVGDHILVESNPYNFRVTGPASADFLVTRIFHVPACVAGFNRLYAFQLIKNGFETPEASPCQCCGLKVGVHIKTPFLKFLSA
jgi:hypothetical protein